MDDSDFVEKSLRSTRELKRKSENRIISTPVIGSDYLLPGGDEDRCFTCNKDLKHLDELRKSLHINHCLDQQEASNQYEAKKEEWKKTVDCPICGKPVQPGPFRAAHAKRCGKKHNVNPNSLLLLLDTQAKVAEARKRNGTAHTKLREPKLETRKRCNRLNEEPHSLLDEQMKLATALSTSMCSSGSEPYTETQELLEKLPKIKSKKLRPRSFSVVELEPHACKCKVVERIQENFLNIFKTRDEKNDMHIVMKKKIHDTEETLKNAGVCVRKLNSLKQMADDLANFAANNSDVIVSSRENETFLACRFIIAARAPALLQLLNPDGSLKLMEYSGAAVRSYIDFLTSASIIWTENEREEVHSMAVKYGPKDLAALCKSPKWEVSSDKETVKHNPKMDTDGNYDDTQKVEEERNCSNAMLRVWGNGKDGTEDVDSDDPSIIFVEEVGRNICFDGVAKNMRSLLKEASENLVRSSPPVFPSNRNNEEFINKNPNSLCSLLEKSSCDEESEVSTKRVPKHVKTNNSFSLEHSVNTDANLPYSLSACSPYLGIMDHFNESVKDSLKKILQIELAVPTDEFLSPDACCSRQAVTNILSSNLTSEKLISPNPSKNSEEIRKSLIKTKSSPEFSVTLKKSSASLSPVSLFDEPLVFHRNVPSSSKKKKIRIATAHLLSTPEIQKTHFARQLKELDSDVKLLKTKDITPMPVYDLMDDEELKVELARFGVRRMGRKRAVALLKKIYLETHPVLESTPISKKSCKFSNSDWQLTTGGVAKSDSDEDCDADETLNVSLDANDIMEESCINDEQFAVLPKDLESMQCILLNWLRREENSNLHNHLLGLNVVPFEELANRLSHADSVVSQIPKKALIEILDRLHVTFQMPMDGWDRKRRRPKK